ncbi:class I SAM-dependent methyltransferase [Chitinophagaceae bacterium LB-8]|uniref:Class I SAM-dependent methyltransferase n=1 Tax=Paraflavisolibacter caeni TaxID=2982496 RepID=A0A9X2XVZ9_9BACT|nr:class I SAM-dependent methyltransferase [Paraflavisolibacter caeni]MCU7550050.1 class I SAM-dependent methyltransferase [Paraflavisolibacter caeni]
MKDLFSEQAAEYARYRPSYPAELFEYIYSFITEHKAAWDCATGNGQAALHLAQHFDQVIASDISTAQLALAPSAPNIQYVNCPAENTPFPLHHFDLITVAQAYHWFNWEAFRKEVARVGKPDAVIAVWTYDLIISDDRKLNDLILHFYRNIVGQYWDAERKWVEEHYQTIPFPYKPLPSKEFSILQQFSREDLIGFFTSWSASQKYLRANGQAATGMIQKHLESIWPKNEERTFRYPVYLKVGRVSEP